MPLENITFKNFQPLHIEHVGRFFLENIELDKSNKDAEVMTPGDVERLEQDQIIKKRLSYIKRKILVMSGKGGVGKSTVSGLSGLIIEQ